MRQPGVALRPATTSDAATLFRWRNDAGTRVQFINTARVPWDAHVEWLKRTLADPDRLLAIGESDGRPVGTVRWDRAGGGWEMSWTVAPECRGQGYGRALLLAAADYRADTLLATVRETNAASIAIAEHAGFVLVRREPGWLYFERPSAVRTR